MATGEPVYNPTTSPVAGSGSDTLAQTYAAGASTADTLITTDATRGPITINAAANTASLVCKSATAINSRSLRLQAQTATQWSQMVNVGFDGATYTTDDNTRCSFEANVNLGTTVGATTLSYVWGTAATNPTRSSVFSLDGSGNLTLGGASTNAAKALAYTNADGGTAASVSFQLFNASSDPNAVFQFGAAGTGFTTSGMFLQDGGFINAGANLSGGLSIGALHATTGDIRLYTGGQNLRMMMDVNGYIAFNSSVAAGQVSGQETLRIYGVSGATALVVCQVVGAGTFAGLQGNKNDGTAGAFMGYDVSGNAVRINAVPSSSVIDLRTQNTTRMTIDASGGVTHNGGALATNATTGFFQIRTMAGTPTGVVSDGCWVLDTTGHKIWFRDSGTWKGVVIA